MTRRAGPLNFAVFEGYLGKDPTQVENKHGTAQCFFDAAQTSFWVDDKGEVRKRRPAWLHFVAFGKVAEVLLDNYRKGDQVVITAELTSYLVNIGGGKRRRTMQLVVHEIRRIDKTSVRSGEAGQERDWIAADDDDSVFSGVADL